MFSKQPFPNILTRKGIVAVASVARSTPRWLDCQVLLTNCPFRQSQLSNGGHVTSLARARASAKARSQERQKGEEEEEEEEDSCSQIIQSD